MLLISTVAVNCCKGKGADKFEDLLLTAHSNIRQDGDLSGTAPNAPKFI